MKASNKQIALMGMFVALNVSELIENVPSYACFFL